MRLTLPRFAAILLLTVGGAFLAGPGGAAGGYLAGLLLGRVLPGPRSCGVEPPPAEERP